MDKSETSTGHWEWEPTDVTLPVEICLTRGRVGTREFPVDLVLDVAHGDESGHDTIPTACLQ